MSRIDELIQELCSDGVKIATLDELCEVANNKRKPVKSDLRTSGTTPYYGANNIQDYVEGYTHDGEYVLIAEDGSASLSNYSVQFAVGKFWANNHVHVVRGKDGVDNRFLFHYFGAMNFMPYLTGGTRAKLNKSKLLEIKIPIPPLDVQKEIASILDKFTRLEAELSAELDARRKQYDFYSSKLLISDSSNDEVKLAGRLDYVRGLTYSKRDEADEGLPVLRANNISISTSSLLLKDIKFIKDTVRTKNTQKLSKGDIFICAGSGSKDHIGKVAYINDDMEYFFGGFMAAIRTKDGLNSRYLYHLLKSQYFRRYLASALSTTTINNLNAKIIESFSWKIPEVNEQEKIADYLDRFDLLLNDMSIGLPAEINTRRQQYEYYRTKLLTFQELSL